MVVKSSDVAKRAGVARSTVSMILNGQADRFSPETRERVERAARELRYRPSVAGRALVRGASDVVIALIPDATFGHNLQDLFEGATEGLAAHGLTLLLRLSTSSPDPLERVVVGMRPRAVVSLQPLTADERAILQAHGVPSVDTSASGDLSGEIAALQAGHLIDRGWRRLAYVGLRDGRGDAYGAGRAEGVRRACADRGLPAPREFSIALDLDEARSALEGVEVGTGIVCCNDEVAITLLTALRHRGLRVPQDVGLVGMDDIPLAAVCDPRLTTVAYDMEVVARNTIVGVLAAIGEGADEVFEDIGLRLVRGGTS